MAHSSNRFGASLLAAAVACGLAAPAIAAPEKAATDSFLVRFKAGTVERGNAVARQKVLDAVGKSQGLHLGQVRHLAVGADLIRTNRKLDGNAARAFMQRLARDSRVEYVEVDRRMHRAMTPNDAAYNLQWHYFEAVAGIGAPAAWDVATGTGTVVAVLDTGIINHVDIGANRVGGYDFISDIATAGDGNGRDADGSDTGDFVAADECGAGEPAQDSSWHGTHVAGTIAALTNNAFGVAGVAFNAKVVPVRVLGKCGGSTSDIADAIVWAAGGAVSGVPANANPAEVINMSLGGGGGCDATTQAAINYAVSQGTTVVVAAGNDASDADAHSPAGCDNVVNVGAVGRTGGKAGYSNFGLSVDLSAPGGAGSNSILSTVDSGATTPTGSAYDSYQGTSMATPHVAGVVALMQSVQVRSPALVEAILKGSARPFPIACTLGCGAGMLTAPDALDAAANPFLYISDPAMVSEGDSGTRTVTFTVSLSETRPSAVTFNIATADGTATAGSDYIAQSLSGQSIPAGQLSKTFVVTLNGDTTVETRETVLVNVTSVVGIDALDTQATANIANDDGPTLANGVTLSGLTAAKNVQTLYRMVVPAGSTDLEFVTTGSAAEDIDIYVRRGDPPTLGKFDCISAGVDTNETCTVPSPAAGTWYVLLNAYSAYNNATLTGSYTAGSVLPNISVADVSLVEGNAGTSLMTFTATLSSASASAVTFNAASANGTATAGSDFVALSASGLSIPAGQLTKTFTVTINGDTAVEANETFLVNLSSVVGANVADGQAVGTITNDDGPKLSINDISMIEGYSGTKTATFTVSLSQVSASAVTFTAATANGTATAGSDYTAKTTTGITIPAGQLSAVFSVTTAGDRTPEPNETFLVNLSAPTNATILDGQGVSTLINDDGPALTIGDAAITEGDAGTKALTFTVQLTRAATVPVTYTIATANGTAAAGSDYVATTLTNETIPAGQIARIFSVPLNGDNTIEADETFAVNLSAATGATILDNQGVGTIANDDTPTVSIADVQLAEGNAGTKVMTFTVLLSKAVGVPVTYNIATANNTASAGTDYVAKTLTGETIPAGQTSRTFTVTLNGDTTFEQNEWFTVTLSSVSGVAVADGQALGVLVNDEGPTLSVNDVGTSEGNLSGKVATFTVSLSQVAAVPVTFTATTANSTALSGYDYIASTQTNLTIPAGQLSRTVEVVIYSDTVVEPNEWFQLKLSAATGATVAKGSGYMTLVNDDGPLLRMNDVSISEGNAGTKVLNFTVSLAPVANNPVTFDIATANGTAAAGTDYEAKALVGETIAAGVGSKTFAVTLNGDTTVEANETIKVNLTNAVGATIYDSQGLGTITNDD